MKKFSITLDSFVVGVVEALGDEALYDHRGNEGFSDFVVKKKNVEILRVARENILFVTISEVVPT